MSVIFVYIVQIALVALEFGTKTFQKIILRYKFEIEVKSC